MVLIDKMLGDGSAECAVERSHARKLVADKLKIETRKGGVKRIVAKSAAKR